MNIALAGSKGRLGTQITNVAQEKFHRLYEITRPSFQDAESLQDELCDAHVLIDVTLAAGTESLCDLILQKSELAESLRAFVVGSTGHTPEQKAKLAAVAKIVPVVVASNFSKGVYLFQQMLSAKTLSGASVADLARALGFDLALWESHHTKKVDAPSGTALTIAESAKIEADRISSTRVGQVVGEHTVHVSGDSESLTLMHTAHNRRLFALGAVDLAERLAESSLEKKVHTIDEVWNKTIV